MSDNMIPTSGEFPEFCEKCGGEKDKPGQVPCDGQSPHSVYNDYGEVITSCGKCSGNRQMPCDSDFHKKEVCPKCGSERFEFAGPKCFPVPHDFHRAPIGEPISEDLAFAQLLPVEGDAPISDEELDALLRAALHGWAMNVPKEVNGETLFRLVWAYKDRAPTKEESCRPDDLGCVGSVESSDISTTPATTDTTEKLSATDVEKGSTSRAPIERDIVSPVGRPMEMSNSATNPVTDGRYDGSKDTDLKRLQANYKYMEGIADSWARAARDAQYKLDKIEAGDYRPIQGSPAAKRIELLQGTIREMKRERTILEQDNYEDAKRISELQDKLDYSIKELDKADQMIIQLDKTIQELTNKHGDALADIEELTEQLASERAEREKEIVMFRKQVATIRELTEEVERLKADLASSAEIMDIRATQLDSFEGLVDFIFSGKGDAAAATALSDLFDKGVPYSSDEAYEASKQAVIEAYAKSWKEE